MSNLNTPSSKTKTLLFLSLGAVISGGLCCFMGEIFLPLTVGILAAIYYAIYYLEGNGAKALSICVSALLLIMNLAFLLIGTTVSLFAPSSIIMAFIASYSFRKAESKADASYIMTVLSALFSLLSCVLLAMMEQGEYTLEAVKTFYTAMYDDLRALTVAGATEIYAASGLQITEEAVSELFDIQVRMLVSYFLIGGFMVTGVSLKIFGFIISRISEDKRAISEWRFATTNIYAYVYLLLTLISLFATSSDSLLGISALNLYNVFLVIFAYVGFKFAREMIMKSMRRGTATLILIVIVCVFYSIAIQLLAVFGVMYTIRSNTQNKIMNS